MSCPRCNAPAADETLREFGGVCPKCLLDFSEEQDAPAFPNLEILEMLGQGGMGVVYKAVQKNLGRTVALKVLSPHLSADPEFVERFTREARALASLSHPNIVGIYDSGIHDHVPYLVMEYVDGTPLRKMLASKKLTPQQVLELIPQICDALHYAHEHGVVHRDIKPENILVDRQGRVRIADFGLAKLASLDETRITKTGYVMGSPHYMAPEQFVHSGRVDHRADIYSLGVVFYEMLTGEIPMGRFKAPSEKAPVDQRFDPVVLKSLEREPDDRWQTVDEVKERVTRLDDTASPPNSREKLATQIIWSIAAMAISLIALVTVARPGAAMTGVVIVLFGVASLMFLWRRSYQLKLQQRPTPPAERNEERNTRIAIGISAGIAVLAIAVIFYLLETRQSDATGGPVMVIVMGVVLLALSATHFRFWKSKTRGMSATSLRRQSIATAAAAAALVLIGIVILLFAVAPIPPAPTHAAVPGKPIITMVATPSPVPQPLRVDDLWPSKYDLSSGGQEEVVEFSPDEFIARAALPPEIAADLESFRGSEVANGKARILGLQFTTVANCLRWWEVPLGGASYRFGCGKRGMILIRHDGSAEGQAIAKRLETAVERNHADATTTDRRK
jgi:serine/threonine protein kinase